MIAPLAKLMDWSAIQAVALMMPANTNNPRLEEALQFLKGPDFVPAQENCIMSSEVAMQFRTCGRRTVDKL